MSLKEGTLKKGPFALSLQEYPQTLNGTTKGQRGLTSALSIKIDKALGFKEGMMLLLQAYYEIKKEQRQYKAIIKRILTGGMMLRKMKFCGLHF